MTNNNENKQANKNNSPNPNKKPRKKKRKLKVWRLILLIFLFVFIVSTVGVGIYVLSIIKTAPKIDPTNVLDTLSQSSIILDQNGNLIEKIHDIQENRDIISFEEIPQNLKDAFIAIEDQSFYSHIGISFKRILGAVYYNIKNGDLKGQGASTITQQLVKNLFLDPDKALKRKIKEAYLAIQIERILTKDQILENYLNAIPLGGKIYGVKAAAYAYYSKEPKDLTLAECATIAATTKNPVWFSPYRRVSMNNLDGIPEEDIVGYIDIDSIRYACVYNDGEPVKRKNIILREMLNLGKITQEEYDSAMKEDIRASLNPGQKKAEGLAASNFTNYIKKQVINDLMEQQKMTYEEAYNYLHRGGLTIYSTMDIDMQKSIESIYSRFGEVMMGTPNYNKNKPLLQDWTGFKWIGGKAYGSLDRYKNILNESGNYLFMKHDNLLDDKDTVYLLPNEYSFDENNNLVIDSKKFLLYSNTINITDIYTIDDKSQLVTHSISGLNIGNNYDILSQKGLKGTFKIHKEYLDKNKDFYSIKDENLYINNKYYTYDKNGIVQPQSATVILDHKTGQIKALVGGREVKGSSTYNRAVNGARQPGSTIKPLGVYLPAIDHGYTAATIIDDVPAYNENGQRWPKNWTEGYRGYAYKYEGLINIRRSLENSVNTNAVKMLTTLGFDTSISYLNKLNLIDKEHPENDTFVSPEENRAYNDMNPSALALGGFTKGFTPLKMAAAYGSIANDGTYTEPICYTKIADRKGNIIINKQPKTNVVVAPEVAFIIKDILRTTVTNGLSYPVSLKSMGIDVGAKTGTTQNNGDLWCIGFSPYYSAAVWVGNDNATMKLSQSSMATAKLMGEIMKTIHAEKEPLKFEVPEGVIKVKICKQSGKLPTNLCSKDPRGSQIYEEYFVKGTEPKEACKTHVSQMVCGETNLLPTQFCPQNTLTEKVFIQRENPYVPADNPLEKNGIYTKKRKSLELYTQVLQDIMNGSSSEEILATYGNQVTLTSTIIETNPIDGTTKENITIKTINGFTIDELNYTMLYTADFMYQVPNYTCTLHNYNTWRNSQVTEDPNESEEDNSNENNENDGNNDENNNESNDENNNDIDDSNIIENNDNNSENTSSDVDENNPEEDDSSSGTLEIITNGN